MKRSTLCVLVLLLLFTLGSKRHAQVISELGSQMGSGGAAAAGGWGWTSTPGSPTATLDSNARFNGAPTYTGIDHEPGDTDCTAAGWTVETQGAPACDSTAGDGLDGSEWAVLDATGGNDEIGCLSGGSCLNGTYSSSMCFRFHADLTGTHAFQNHINAVYTGAGFEGGIQACLEGACNGEVKFQLSGADGTCDAAAVDVGDDPNLVKWFKVCFTDMDTSTIDIDLWAVDTEADLAGSPTSSCSTATDLLGTVDGIAMATGQSGSVFYIDNVTVWDGDPDD